MDLAICNFDLILEKKMKSDFFPEKLVKHVLK